MGLKAKVAERGQITIPKILRDRLGIHPGTILKFEEEAGKIIMIKTSIKDPLDQIYGSLGNSRRTDEIIDELRDAQ